MSNRTDMSKSRPRLTIAVLATALASAVVVLGGCSSGETIECETTAHEAFPVDLAGTCVPAPVRIALIRDGCSVTLEGGLVPGTIPERGFVDQSKHALRQGGWQLVGLVCASGQTRCQTRTEPRRCTAKRVEWRLELECHDGSGMPVCSAVITE